MIFVLMNKILTLIFLCQFGEERGMLEVSNMFCAVVLHVLWWKYFFTIVLPTEFGVILRVLACWHYFFKLSWSFYVIFCVICIFAVVLHFTIVLPRKFSWNYLNIWWFFWNFWNFYSFFRSFWRLFPNFWLFWNLYLSDSKVSDL